jgi:hypothetical protein
METASISAVAANSIPDWPQRGSCQTKWISVPLWPSLPKLKLDPV